MIAFFGMGLLGSNFVRALRKRGEDVHVWNRSADKARALESVGAKAFDDPAAAATRRDARPRDAVGRRGGRRRARARAVRGSTRTS